MRDKIIISGMEFYGKHGVLAEERVLGQKFLVDIEMYVDLQEAGNTDQLNRTINYAEVYQAVREIVQGPSCHLIETVAEKIARTITEVFGAERVMVRVKKPQAPIPGPFEFVAVEIVRGQGD